MNIAKRINDRHQLITHRLRRPCTHNKRGNKDGLFSIMNYCTYAKEVMGSESPYRYNATFGYDLHGQVSSSNRNTYHKPPNIACAYPADRQEIEPLNHHLRIARQRRRLQRARAAAADQRREPQQLQLVRRLQR